MRVIATYFPNARDGDTEAVKTLYKNTKRLQEEQPEAIFLEDDDGNILGYATKVKKYGDHIIIEYEVQDEKYRKELLKEGFKIK